MHRGVDPAFCQPDIEFTCPQRFTADFCQRAILYLVTAGDNRNQFHRAFIPPMRCAQARTRFMRLGQSKRRATGSKSKNGCGGHRVGLP